MPEVKPNSAPVNGPPLVAAVYSPMARMFHWLTLALLAIQIPLGLFMTNYAERTKFAEPSGRMYDTHKLLGMVILLVVAARLIYRFRNGAPDDEPTLEPWQKLISHLTHWGIYGLLVAVPFLGWLAVSFYGPFAPFGIRLPALASENQAVADTLFKVHKYSAFLLILMVGMHIGAALFHYVIRKDGVLNRMLPALPRRDGN